MTHTECSLKARNSTPCSAGDITFGGQCLSCGYDPEKDKTQKEKKRTRATKLLTRRVNKKEATHILT